MEEWLSRTEQLLGKDTLSALQNSHVLIVGVGGVGAYAAEMICRAGVQEITIIDGDNVNPTNINRQLIAMHSTVGKTQNPNSRTATIGYQSPTQHTYKAVIYGRSPNRNTTR